jgi:HEAT repeat protein
LRRLLDDADPEVRTAAAEAMGQMGDERAFAPLVKDLVDRDKNVRRAAAASLAKLGRPEWAQWVQGNAWDFDRLGTSGDPGAVDMLVGALTEGPEDVRKAAARALGQSRDERAMPALRRRLGDPDGGVRKTAAVALSKLDEPKWSPWIKGDYWLDDINRLSRSGDPDVFEPLREALTTAFTAYAWDATRQRQVPCDAEFRRTAAEALGNLSDVRAVEPLTRALEDEDGDVRKAAADALAKLEASGVAKTRPKAKTETISEGEGTLVVKCPNANCGAKLRVPPDYTHHRARCGACGQVVDLGEATVDPDAV